jgi:hypothetical protein
VASDHLSRILVPRSSSPAAGATGALRSNPDIKAEPRTPSPLHAVEPGAVMFRPRTRPQSPVVPENLAESGPVLKTVLGAALHTLESFGIHSATPALMKVRKRASDRKDVEAMMLALTELVAQLFERPVACRQADYERAETIFRAFTQTRHGPQRRRPAVLAALDGAPSSLQNLYGILCQHELRWAVAMFEDLGIPSARVVCQRINAQLGDNERTFRLSIIFFDLIEQLKALPQQDHTEGLQYVEKIMYGYGHGGYMANRMESAVDRTGKILPALTQLWAFACDVLPFTVAIAEPASRPNS